VYDPAMKRSDWERDIEARQRNFVFPDTMLNTGRFYRNLANAKMLSAGQRIGSIFLGLMVIGSALFFFLSSLDSFRHSKGLVSLAWIGVIAITVIAFSFGCASIYYSFAAPSMPKPHHKPKDLQHSDKF
jgi:hypothetical protein